MAASTDQVESAVKRGIPLEILDCDVDSKLLCTVCMLLPRNPVQGYCGHRFCNDCIDSQLRYVSCFCSIKYGYFIESVLVEAIRHSTFCDNSKSTLSECWKCRFSEDLCIVHMLDLALVVQLLLF